MSERTVTAFTQFRDALQRDPAWAWTWHCNIAMVAQDAGAPHAEANARTASFMKTTFGVDTSKAPDIEAGPVERYEAPTDWLDNRIRSLTEP